MSKFNAKNLSYEVSEPAFLRKLRGEYGGVDSVRHERPLARPRKQATDGNDDDQPTYVVEESQDVMSKDEYEALMQKEDGEVEGGRSKAEEKEGLKIAKDVVNKQNNLAAKGLKPGKDQIAAIGGAKKKRTIKAVGADVQEDGTEGEKKKPRKGKKVKLSFEEIINNAAGDLHKISIAKIPACSEAVVVKEEKAETDRAVGVKSQLAFGGA